jgi:beta-phosphoglucomutase-like phosphatase (HAD superfamily)
MSIQAVVFDMDGVLIDSEIIWRRVREVYAAEIGSSWTQADQAAMMGCSTSDWSARMRERLGLTQLSAADLANEIRQRVVAAFELELTVRPGAVQALAALAAGRGHVGHCGALPGVSAFARHARLGARRGG